MPTYRAAEALLFFAAYPERTFVRARRAFRYGPSSRELEQRIGELADAYNEWPVTLIKVIYAMARQHSIVR